MRTSLYRHFSSDGTLLYVGISINALTRLLQHRSNSVWGRDIARVEIEHYPSRMAAKAEEDRAIANERPLHNSKPGRRGRQYKSIAARTDSAVGSAA